MKKASILSSLKCGIKIQLNSYDGSHLVNRLVEPWSNATAELTFGGAKWECRVQADGVPGHQDAIDLVARFKVIEGAVKQVSAGITFAFDDWSADNYVLMPGAVYNGNRFKSHRLKYSPRLTAAADVGPDKPPIVSDIPRLNIDEGKSEIQLLARDMTTPAIGFHSPKIGKGFWCLNDERTEHGPVGMFI
ncbi:MAG: hypothetical protein KOO69_02330, partial [Victivallales bacterium]|nr:hypothetical protein [Victivallales bacterium]